MSIPILLLYTLHLRDNSISELVLYTAISVDHVDMALTKERKIFLALGAAAGIAMLGDRIFFGSTATGPSSASAKTFSPLRPDPTPATPQNADPQVSDPTSMLAQSLRDIETKENFSHGVRRDAFQSLGIWNVPDEPDKPKNHGYETTVKFQQKHRLEAVIPNGSRRYAMVDGTPLFIGQKLDGFTLIDIRNRSAFFELYETHIELRMDHKDAAMINIDTIAD